MNTESLIHFFQSKLEKLSDLKLLADYRDPLFRTWWNTITATYERMGKSYIDKANRVRFSPGMVIGGQDNSSRYSSAYQKGLSDAEALISSTIEELEMWGFGEEPSHKAPSVKASEKVILNLTISQQQAQQISQTINLSQYDAEVQSKVNELLDELKKKSKNKTKIVDAVKWLADKGTDALIAILIAGLHLS